MAHLTPQRQPSHPLVVQGLFEVYKEIDSEFVAGARYGYHQSLSAIPCTTTDSGSRKNFSLKLLGYGAGQRVLLKDHVYFMSGRLLGLNVKALPRLSYFPESVISLGPSGKVEFDGADKVTVTGFGIITSQETVSSEKNSEETIVCTIEHCDWDCINRKSVTFSAIYQVPKTRVLTNTHGLFQLGREVVVYGLIVDWNKQAKAWTIEVLGVSVASGHQSIIHKLPIRGSSMKPKPIPKGKLIELYSTDSEEEEQEHKNKSSVKATDDTHFDSNSEIQHITSPISSPISITKLTKNPTTQRTDGESSNHDILPLTYAKKRAYNDHNLNNDTKRFKNAKAPWLCS